MSNQDNSIIKEALESSTKKLETLQVSEVVEKKPKQRKGQTEDEFLEQKRQYEESGPKINTENWLHDKEILSKLDNTLKPDRVHMLHACEHAFYLRDYKKCLELIKTGENLFGVELEDGDANDELKNDFQSAAKKTRKSNKVERHVIELLHIKEACLKKIATQEAV